MLRTLIYTSLPSRRGTPLHLDTMALAKKLTQFQLLLESKADFIDAKVAAGEIPNGSQLAAFMQALTVELGQRIKQMPPAISRMAAKQVCAPPL